MSPSTFRETVALVAARATERLPEAVNGRIEGAVKLVLAHDVITLRDGTIAVGSSTDPLKTYTLTGQTCTCTDFVQGKAPEGWCKHRIAAGIDKRVREVLAALPAPTPATPAASLPEAPASVNVRLVLDGREVQLTLRDSDETRLLARLEAVLARFPLPTTPSTAPGEGWCSRHTVQMKQTTKDGRSWWSHKTDQGWCKGK
jgi:hypothetical protein